MGQDQGQQGQQQQQGSGQHVSSSTDAPMFAKRPQTQGEQPQGGHVCGHGYVCEDGGGEGRHLSQGQGNPDPGAQSVGVQGEGREGGKVAVGIQQAGGGKGGICHGWAQHEPQSSHPGDQQTQQGSSSS